MQKVTSLLSVFILLSNFCLAQQNSASELDSIAAPLIKSLRLSTTEQVLLQTDKRFYKQGETIWFKAYIVDSLSNRISYGNKVLFVDLVDDKDSVINQLLLHGDGGSASGSMMLNDSTLQGYYWLRAYTHKMTSTTAGNMGIQPVFISNSKKSSFHAPQFTKAAAKKGAKTLIEVYPEGGWIISGTNSVVALKVQDASGNALVLPGVVKDSRDAVVAQFTTNHQGNAKFSFTPKWYEKYKIYILNKDKYDSMGVLPRVNPYAAQLSVIAQNEEAIRIRVMLEDSIFSKDYTSYIIRLA